MFDLPRTTLMIVAGAILSFGACQSTEVAKPQDPFVVVTPEVQYQQPIEEQLASIAPVPPENPLTKSAQTQVLVAQKNETETAENKKESNRGIFGKNPFIKKLPEINDEKLNEKPQIASNPIRQVAFLNENGMEENDSTANVALEPANLDRISIDPALAEQGAKIVAQYHYGRQPYCGSWRPEGVCGFWPATEYLVDGGDQGLPVNIEEDWTVNHLGIEDTVVHADTLDGRVVVEPSNRVHLYAPRFGSVRKIEGIINNTQLTTASNATNQLALNVDRGNEQLGFTAQETRAGYARTRSQLNAMDGSVASVDAAGRRKVLGYGGIEAVMSYTNLLHMQAIGSAELAYLAEGSASARAWQGAEGVKVQMNSLAPMSASSEQGAESFFQVDVDSKTSKLRLIKVADKKSAQPGDIVEFTLRFDNVGPYPIGNVTVLDNLTTRLEFVPGSAKSSLPSGFVVQPNEAGSLVLRFEVTDPLLPGQFGVVQFQCRVR